MHFVEFCRFVIGYVLQYGIKNRLYELAGYHNKSDEPFRILNNFQENGAIWLQNKSIRIVRNFSEYIKLKRRQTN